MLRNSLFPGIVEKRLMQVADILPEKLVICEKEKMGKLCHITLSTYVRRK